MKMFSFVNYLLYTYYVYVVKKSNEEEKQVISRKNSRQVHQSDNGSDRIS